MSSSETQDLECAGPAPIPAGLLEKDLHGWDEEDIDLIDVGVDFVDSSSNPDDSQDSHQAVDFSKSSLVRDLQTRATTKDTQEPSVNRMTSTAASTSSEQLLSFDGCEDLRRGTRLFVLLRSFGRIFKNSEGSSVTYALSESVEELDGFVSHNWVVSRAIKFLVLAFHYNVYLAFAVAYIVATLAGILNIAGVFPSIQNLISGPDGREVGFVARLVCGPTFLVSLFLSSELQYLLGRKGPALFLDKSCIHQTDQGLQRQGIEKLGAFVANSRHMIVIYSDVYLRKLWTVFELASFLMVKNTKDLVVLPLEVSVLTCIECYSSWVCNVFEFLIQSWWDNIYIQYVAGLSALSLCAVTFRVLAHKKAHILASLTNFTVDAASCAVEADRPIIYASIHSLVAHFHGNPDCDEEMDEETALRAFETVVRERMPRALVKQMGVLVLPLRLLLVVTTLHVTPFAWDNIAFIGTSDESAIQIFSYIVSRFSWLVWAPACIAVAMYLPGLKLEYSGWREILWVGLAALATGGTYCFFIVLADLVETSRAALVAALASDVVLAGAVLWACWLEASATQQDEIITI